MKVSIDAILGTARKINRQKELEDGDSNRKKNGIKLDSLTIGGRINTRIDAMETEFREIQSSLTKNQIIRDGIEQLRGDLQKGGRERKNILNNVAFEGKNVLRGFIGETVNEAVINDRMAKNTARINDDVNRLKKLQVELDNIMASDLVGQDRIGGIMKNIDSIFSRSDMKNIENISTLSPDAVMRLIK